MTSDSSARENRHPTASVLLDDGTMIEMVHSTELGRTALVKWSEDSVQEHDEVELPTLGRLVPYSPRNNLLTHGVVLFPSGVREFENAALLRSQIQAFIHRYADLSREFEEIASYYVL